MIAVISEVISWTSPIFSFLIVRHCIVRPLRRCLKLSCPSIQCLAIRRCPSCLVIWSPRSNHPVLELPSCPWSLASCLPNLVRSPRRCSSCPCLCCPSCLHPQCPSRLRPRCPRSSCSQGRRLIHRRQPWISSHRPIARTCHLTDQLELGPSSRNLVNKLLVNLPNLWDYNNKTNGNVIKNSEVQIEIFLWILILEPSPRLRLNMDLRLLMRFSLTHRVMHLSSRESVCFDKIWFDCLNNEAIIEGA